MSLVNQNVIGGSSALLNQIPNLIPSSLRFNASQSSYLSWTPASAGNRKTWTWSGWFKKGVITNTGCLFGAGTTTNSGNGVTEISFQADNTMALTVWQFISGVQWRVTTSAIQRDPSAWYHFVITIDTTQATSSNRVKIYINGVQQTSLFYAVYPSQNYDTGVNATNAHGIGRRPDGSNLLDGYLTEVNFIDGQALDPSSFGEFDSVTGVWKPAKYTGTYGTNGFYLPMKLDNTVEGFNTVTYIGTGSTQNITGVGFSPDLVWMKSRSSGTRNHFLFDSVRGAGNALYSNLTNAEASSFGVSAFNTDGFTVGANGNGNESGGSYVAWCWDAGSSTVSNTDGSITSSVRANPTYGFSVVTYTGNGTDGATVAHGLNSAPEFSIIKNRGATTNWDVAFEGISGGTSLNLDTTSAVFSPTLGYHQLGATTLTLKNGGSGIERVNTNTGTYVAYCFHSVAGYSKFGSYTGTAASGNAVTTGFRPAFVMVKCSSDAENWTIFDNVRDTVNPNDKGLYANTSDAEVIISTNSVNFTDTGFELNGTGNRTNGSGKTYIYMAFADTREYAYWLDDSGNNNDWQPNGGITTESTVTDTPTPYADGGNYATWNPLWGNSNPPAFSTANLVLSPSGSGYNNAISTIAMPATGYWYAEFTATANVPYGGGNNNSIGVVATTRGTLSGSNYIGQYSDTYGYFDGGGLYNNGSVSQTVASYVTSDVIMVALGNGKLWWGKNGTWLGTGSPNPATATSPAFSGLSGDYFFGAMTYNSPYGGTWSANFGQRPFAYTPPTGFKPLHTGNLPDSAIVDGSEYFNVVAYTATEDVPSSITGVGFQPDFVWVKTRADVASHALSDSVRGVQKLLSSNTTGAEGTSSTYLTSFDSDGFTQGGAGNFARNSLISWNWKANGAGVSNTDGSITSTVSANPTAGFSIVTYTGTGSAATLGHGLGVAPAFFVTKQRSGAENWIVYHKNQNASPASGHLMLQSTSAFISSSAVFNNTAPTSTVFSVGTAGGTNESGQTFVAYCFADVEGYSKFGSYTGNGSADGPFLYTGFRPAFIITKRTNSATNGNWTVFDTERNTINAAGTHLRADTSEAELVFGTGIDILSNGFKIREAANALNASGSTYIYMAFAENPFKNSLAR